MRFDPAGPDLAQPRSLRALERPRFDAALVGAASHQDTGGQCRLREARAALRVARRHPPLPPARQQGPGPSGVPLGSGVETTTGPLGQGVATSVGMAIAQKWLANRYNRPGFEIFDYNIYAVCGDGCMMEGVASEAASLAGHLGLDNLCWVYDNNHITIEGNTSITFTEDVAARFLAYGWNVLRVGDANDIERIEHALAVFRKTQGRPTFIVLDSHIGYGSPHKQDTAAAHGEPLGEEEVRLTKRGYGWPEDAKFLVPDGVLRALRCRHRSARRAGPAGMDGTLRSVSRQVSGPGDRDRPDAAARTAGRLGSQPPVVPGGSERRRWARRIGQGAERARAEHPVVSRRLGRSRPVEQDHVDLRGRRRFPSRHARAARTCISASASTRWARW